MAAPSEAPDGLRYVPDFITPTEEAELSRHLEALAYEEVKMHGLVARRTVAHFGWTYGFESWAIVPGTPIPDWLLWLRVRCGTLAGVEPARLTQALVIRYPPGAGIGWHRDAPMFGPVVVGVSLLSATRMRFQRGTGAQRRVSAIELAPRSAYVLAGPARSVWQHSIPATKALRYSITYRTVLDEAKWYARAAQSEGASAR